MTMLNDNPAPNDARLTSPELAGVSLGARLLLVAMLAAFLIGGALVRPIDHDESQYVAAAVLAWGHLPYRDFDYLQTPLQPLVLAPLARAAGAHALLALRLANAVMALLAVLLLDRALGLAGVGRRRALALALLLAACEPVLFAASTARNDVMPCLLTCGALATMMAMARDDAYRRAWRSAVLGLLLAAAAAIKISYAVPLLAVPIAEVLARRHGTGRLVVPAFLLGAGVVAAVVGTIAAQAPHAFWFDVIRFPSAAPHEWYAAPGHDMSRLGWLGRLRDYLRFLILGPAPALIALLAWRLRRHRAGADRDWAVGMLDALLLATLVASWLAVPIWRQYLVPLLPVLILRVGLAVRGRPIGVFGWIAIAAFAVVGLAQTAKFAAAAVRHGAPPLLAERDGRAIRALLAGRHGPGVIASLSPERIAGQGFALDPRFAAGPFLFRTRHGLGEGARLVGVTRASFAQRLQHSPPAAIVVGGEALDSGDPTLDATLTAWALQHGYVIAGTTPLGLSVLVRPAA